MNYKDFEILTKGETPVLIDFYADWCGPCRTLSPIIKEIKDYYGDQIKVVKIDVDRDKKVAGRLNIMSIPTIMLYQRGEVKWRVAGVRSARDIKKVVDKTLGIEKQKEPSERLGFLKSLFKKKN